MKAVDLYKSNLAELGDSIAAAAVTLAQVIERERYSDMMNPGDVADMLSVSPDTVLNWIRTGQLKAANIATGSRPRWIIQRSHLDRFLELRQRRAA